MINLIKVFIKKSAGLTGTIVEFTTFDGGLNSQLESEGLDGGRTSFPLPQR
jgi:hypothetical protein